VHESVFDQSVQSVPQMVFAFGVHAPLATMGVVHAYEQVLACVTEKVGPVDLAIAEPGHVASSTAAVGGAYRHSVVPAAATQAWFVSAQSVHVCLHSDVAVRTV